MPTADILLARLGEIAAHYLPIAVGWHVAIAYLVAAMVVGWRPSQRTAAFTLIAPVASVAVIAFLAANPFNGAIFLALAGLLAALAGRLRPAPIEPARTPALLVGVAMVAFGLSYPHFLPGARFAYLYAAPLGLLPCPTLSLVIGFSMIAGGFGSRWWSGVLAFAGLFYGLFGAVRLGVTIDHALTVGALALGAMALAPVGRSGRPLQEPLVPADSGRAV